MIKGIAFAINAPKIQGADASIGITALLNIGIFEEEYAGH